MSHEHPSCSLRDRRHEDADDKAAMMWERKRQPRTWTLEIETINLVPIASQLFRRVDLRLLTIRRRCERMHSLGKPLLASWQPMLSRSVSIYVKIRVNLSHNRRLFVSVSPTCDFARKSSKSSCSCSWLASSTFCCEEGDFFASSKVESRRKRKRREHNFDLSSETDAKIRFESTQNSGISIRIAITHLSCVFYHRKHFLCPLGSHHASQSSWLGHDDHQHHHHGRHVCVQSQLACQRKINFNFSSPSSKFELSCVDADDQLSLTNLLCVEFPVSISHLI